LRTPIAIVGNGGAAAQAIATLRSCGYRDRIDLFSDNQHAPYNPMLGTYILTEKLRLENGFPFGDQLTFYEGNAVTFHAGQAVAFLDPARQELTTEDGLSYQYDRCLVASGARPSLPPVPGLQELLSPQSAPPGRNGSEPRAAAPGAAVPADDQQSQRVFTMRSLADVLALKDKVRRLQPPGGLQEGARAGRAVVIGASLAGIKVAEALAECGLEVCLLEQEPQILPRVAHPLCARLLEDHLLGEGYQLHLRTILLRVQSRKTSLRLIFSSGEDESQEEVDLAVICTGVRPALDFLPPGLVSTEQGILVDNHLRSSIPTLYAAGDVAQGKNLLTSRHEIIGRWASARYQGRAAGWNLAGRPSEYPGTIPQSIAHVGGLLFASLGCATDFDEANVVRIGQDLRVDLWKNRRLVGVNMVSRCLAAGVWRHALLKAATGEAGTVQSGPQRVPAAQSGAAAASRKASANSVSACESAWPASSASSSR
jgi:NADPH-dependent 2,4-dienoyl-CoA reductase/sulfur reductase-like enzyme